MAVKREIMHYAGALIGERLENGKVWIWDEQSDEMLTVSFDDLVEMVDLMRVVPEEDEAHRNDLRDLKAYIEALEAENEKEKEHGRHLRSHLIDREQRIMGFMKRVEDLEAAVKLAVDNAYHDDPYIWQKIEDILGGKTEGRTDDG